MATIVLFDDERSFKPGVHDDALVVRTVRDAEALFPTLEAIDELWLDFVLSPGDTTEALHALAGVKVNRVIFHSSAFAARSLIEYHLRKNGIMVNVEFPPMPSVLVN
jgi:hypothetical protein